jgi:hypothetical protein
MKSRLVPPVVLALSVVVGCGSPNKYGATSSSGGSTSTGGTSPSTDSGGGPGGVSSGGAGSSGGVIGQGGSGGSSVGSGGSGDGGSGGSNTGGTAVKGGSGGTAGTSGGSGGNAAGGTSSGGTTVKGGSGGGSGGAAGSPGGSRGTSTGGTNPGGTTAKGGSSGGSGGSAGAGGTITSGGTTSAGGTTATGGTTTTTTGPKGPCDIYQAAGQPCGAAHSTVRALYASYTGPLYQVQRASDKKTQDITVGSGGFANTSAQDSFCSGTTCTIPVIYDQSPNGNHLRVTWFAYWMQKGGNPANVAEGKITVGGHTVYGIRVGGNTKDVGYRTGVQLAGTASITKGSSTVTFSSPQTLPANTPLLFTANTPDCPPDSWPNNCNFKPYYTSAEINAATTVTLKTSYSGTSSSSSGVWNHATKGLATGDQAEAMYSVFDGKIYSQWCCTDYGNAELDGIDDGNATMECIYWGADTQFGQSGGGSGPWIGADLENGMFEGYENGSAKVSSNTTITGWPYVTLLLKGLSAPDCPSGLTSSGCYALKAGNAQSGNLEWKWNATTKNYGARPPNYSPQKKQGAVILATGGDGSNTGNGIWFEGAITMGATSDATDDAVQANIVALGYGK